MFRGNTVTVILFFSDIKKYVPVKLCKTAGSINLFKFFGQPTPDQITLERKIIMGCSESRLKRSLYDFEWNYSVFA